jgi:hypothetical protein
LLFLDDNADASDPTSRLRAAQDDIAKLAHLVHAILDHVANSSDPIRPAA